MKLVGFIFDPTLSWGPMITHLAKKARVRLGAVCRLRRHLTAENMETMYTAFVRSVLEYGNALYMSACPTHLAKLDKIQTAAEKMGGFELESLADRREAAAISLGLKLLDGAGRGSLQQFAPKLVDNRPGSAAILSSSSTVKRRHAAGLQVAPFVRNKKKEMLGPYERSYFGVLPAV